MCCCSEIYGVADGEADGEGDSSAVELFFLAEAFFGEPEGEGDASVLVELFFLVELVDAAVLVPAFLVDFLAVVDSVVDAAVVLVSCF
ncbi:MAG: hypothetical protein QOE73_944 [Verrucomicrobiota bacterium]